MSGSSGSDDRRGVDDPASRRGFAKETAGALSAHHHHRVSRERKRQSLLNRLLRDPALADTLVIINEFGEIGLDHLLVERIDGDMLVMTSGCLCCSIRGDLIATLEDILRRRDNGRIAPFERVIIETTGLADPAPVLHTIMVHPYFRLRFRLDGVITLVDAVNGSATLDTQEEAVKQAAMADRLVISKTDLLAPADAPALQALRERLADLNPGAPLLDAAQGEATAAKLLDIGPYDPACKIPDVSQWLNAEAFAAGGTEAGHGHHHEGPEEHRESHDLNRHDARIQAFCLRHEVPLPPACSRTLSRIAAHGARAKIIAGQGDRFVDRRSFAARRHPGRSACLSSAAPACGMARQRSCDPDRFHFA